MDLDACARGLLAIVVSGWPAATAVRGTGVVVGLVDRLPSIDEVAEGVSHRVDVSRPVLGPVLLKEKSALGREPCGQREVVQANPRRNAGVARRGQDVAVSRELVLIDMAFVGLDAGPLDGQPVVGQSKP